MSESSAAPSILQISVELLADRLAASQTASQSNSKSNSISEAKQLPVQLIDVREPDELAIAMLDGFVNLPLSQFAAWREVIADQFDPHTETLVLCHHGVRSAQMCHWLIQQGFTNVKNIAGGIDAYSTLIDDSVPRY